jgi:hypothetical protein
MVEVTAKVEAPRMKRQPMNTKMTSCRCRCSRTIEFHAVQHRIIRILVKVEFISCSLSIDSAQVRKLGESRHAPLDNFGAVNQHKMRLWVLMRPIIFTKQIHVRFRNRFLFLVRFDAVGHAAAAAASKQVDLAK